MRYRLVEASNLIGGYEYLSENDSIDSKKDKFISYLKYKTFTIDYDRIEREIGTKIPDEEKAKYNIAFSGESFTMWKILKIFSNLFTFATIAFLINLIFYHYKSFYIGGGIMLLAMLIVAFFYGLRIRKKYYIDDVPKSVGIRIFDQMKEQKFSSAKFKEEWIQVWDYAIKEDALPGKYYSTSIMLLACMAVYLSMGKELLNIMPGWK